MCFWRTYPCRQRRGLRRGAGARWHRNLAVGGRYRRGDSRRTIPFEPLRQHNLPAHRPLFATATSRIQAASAWAKSIASPGPANETARTKSSYSLAHRGSVSSRRSISANIATGSPAGAPPPLPTSAAAAASTSSGKRGAAATCCSSAARSCRCRMIVGLKAPVLLS
jgi:hypothetical protein